MLVPSVDVGSVGGFRVSPETADSGQQTRPSMDMTRWNVAFGSGVFGKRAQNRLPEHLDWFTPSLKRGKDQPKSNNGWLVASPG